MRICDLGLMEYALAHDRQCERLAQVAAGAEDTLYFLEHPRVITLGRHGGRGHLLVDEARLAAEGIALVQSARGGDITCHYPGQLVAYPIFHLGLRPGGLRRFVFDLEDVIVRTLKVFGLSSTRIPGRHGVWVGQRKIAFIGIALRRWVSYHGLSLNVGRDVSFFECITPCGLRGIEVTSLCRELADDSITMQEVKGVCAREFETVFAHSAVAAHPTSR